MIKKLIGLFKKKKTNDKNSGYSGKRPRMMGSYAYRTHDDIDPKDIPEFKSSIKYKK